MIGYVALAITVIIIVSVCARIDNWQRDWSTNFAETSVSAADPDLRPLTLNQRKTEVAKEILRWAETQRAWRVVTEDTAGDSIQLHLTRTTPILRMVDDVHVTIVDERPEGSVDDDWSIVTATSQSRVGKGDLGQNPRNLKELCRTLRSK